jgi:low affinity Fe/Cu permease
MTQESGRFERFATWTAKASGHAIAFGAAVLVTVAWAVSGPLFHFSDTWQLVINTATTVLTFLMVFVIQNSLNRDSAAVHVKLDELIRVTAEARDALVGAEHMAEEDLEQMREQIQAHAGAAGHAATDSDSEDQG